MSYFVQLAGRDNRAVHVREKLVESVTDLAEGSRVQLTTGRWFEVTEEAAVVRLRCQNAGPLPGRRTNE